MIKNLILDIGNVICEWNPERLSSMVTDNPEHQKEVLEATVRQQDWLDLDRGVLSVDEAITNALERTNLDKAIVAGMYHKLGESMWIIDATVAAMHKASDAGIPIYILSNMQEHTWEYLRTTHDCFNLCTGVIVSCEAQLIKPDPEIYAHLCKRFSLVPSECIFIDDMAENIDAARRCGWHAEQVEKIEHADRVLTQVLDSMR